MLNVFTSVYSGARGAKFNKHFKWEASYKSLGTFGVAKQR